MSVTMPPPQADPDEQRVVLRGVGWETYVAQCNSAVHRGNPRMIYCGGRLVLMGKSRRHEWMSECFGHLVMAIATRLRISCEPAGEATYRRHEKDAGLEGGRTFHIGADAEWMRGDRDYDFEIDPPPDLAIEVEVSHSADIAVEAWGRLGVPEIWRFHAKSFACTFWSRRDDGSYEQVARSLAFSMLEPSDVVEQLRRAKESGTVRWLAQLPSWIDDLLRRRLDGDAGSTVNGLN